MKTSQKLQTQTSPSCTPSLKLLLVIVALSLYKVTLYQQYKEVLRVPLSPGLVHLFLLCTISHRVGAPWPPSLLQPDAEPTLSLAILHAYSFSFFLHSSAHRVAHRANNKGSFSTSYMRTASSVSIGPHKNSGVGLTATCI